MNVKTMYLVSIVAIVAVVAVWWWFCLGMTTIVFLRHADRNGSQDALSSLGSDRAQELVHVAEKSGATAIYHSGATRTEKTAEPLAIALGITMTEIAGAAETVNDIFANHRGETVVVVGHSDTVPDMIELAGGPAMADIQHNEYDNLFMVTRCHCWYGPTKVLNLQYGVISP